MCGLLFFRDRSGLVQSLEHVRALSRMTQRGPDHSALVYGADFLIGHTRLAIIDPTPESNQPFWDRDGWFALVLNGEIYNYKELRNELLGTGLHLKTKSVSG